MTQEILDPYGKTFDWSVKSKMMGRGSLEAAKVLVEELQLPLTPEEVVKISQDKLLEQFPSALLMPGENIKFIIHIYLFFVMKQLLQALITAHTCDTYNHITCRH